MQVLFCYLFNPNVSIVVCNGQTISGLEPNSVWLGAENKIEAAFWQELKEQLLLLWLQLLNNLMNRCSLLMSCAAAQAGAATLHMAPWSQFHLCSTPRPLLGMHLPPRFLL